MEKDIGVGVVLIILGLLFGWWNYKNPTKKTGETDMLNSDFKGYMGSIMAIIMGITLIVRAISSGHSTFIDY